jgi:3'-phosphoadenosine 5'-phosphosulfate sulfotransferase (PAPS reductase)/FAD synthetase
MVIKTPQEIYEDFREWFYDHLNKFESWDEYRIEHLRQSSDFKYNRSYYPEQVVNQMYDAIQDSFFAEFSFLKRYNPKYQVEYQQMLKGRSSHDRFELESPQKGFKIQVELFNIPREELWYPNVARTINVHSALHSLAMFIKEKDHPAYKDRQIAQYMRPLLTHPGDREYTLYYLQKFNYPTVVLSRLENLSWLMQINGLPKMGVFGGRWCTRILKLEPSVLFFKEFFYPWEYKLTKAELVNYCKRYKVKCTGNRGAIVKTIKQFLKGLERLGIVTVPPPTKTMYYSDDTPYQIYKWNNIEKAWAMVDYSSAKIPRYVWVKEEKTWKPLNSVLQIKNIVQLIGINKYHSGKRRIDNPNVTYAPISVPHAHFFIYQFYPIFSETPDDMTRIIRECGVPIRRNPFEQKYDIFYQEEFVEVTEKEYRYGCILCPYKGKKYYEDLRDNHPDLYYYCQLLRLLGSARKIMKKGAEYHYYPRKTGDPIMKTTF